MYSLYFLFVYLFYSTECSLSCSKPRNNQGTTFQLIQTQALSTSTTVLASDSLPTLQDCQEFALEIHGMALNFLNMHDVQHDEDTCIVYDCPEVDLSVLDLDTLFDYYSVYDDIDADLNATCVPRVGMFVLYKEPANYSLASSTCEQLGRLANVISHERTSQLSTLLRSLEPLRPVRVAYVGLTDVEQEGVFVTEEAGSMGLMEERLATTNITNLGGLPLQSSRCNAGEPLDCFDYRGWAPGHPRSRFATEDCVVLDSRRWWRVVKCARKLPFICELSSINIDA